MHTATHNLASAVVPLLLQTPPLHASHQAAMALHWQAIVVNALVCLWLQSGRAAVPYQERMLRVAWTACTSNDPL